jgi:hypothetical protein
VFRASALDPGLDLSRQKGRSMAHLQGKSGTAFVAGIAEPHQSTVAAIPRAVRQGLLTETEAQPLIDRVGAGEIGCPSEGGEPPRGVVVRPGSTVS